MSEKEWIELIASDAQKAANLFGYLPSVLIAQTCQENGYGMDESCRVLTEVYNILGMKRELLNSTWSSDYWDGEYITKKTPEWNSSGMYYKYDQFRKYDSFYSCLADYCQFMRDARYSKGGSYKYRDLLGTKDPYTLIEGVRSRGYCTDPGYSKAVTDIIEKHNLTQYDPKEEKMDIKNINRNYMTTYNSYSVNDPRYIIIHNTDNFNRGANAKAHAVGLYNGDMQSMSWHYVTDDASIYQCLPHNRGAMHVGKNFGSGNLFGIVNNRNSICIEMCCNAGYDYEAAFQNTVALTRHLMKELDISADCVLQHYDVCSKDCPSQIRAHGDWNRFKAAILRDTDNLPTIPAGLSEEQKLVAQGQIETIRFTGISIKVDGVRGKNTKANMIRCLQRAANFDWQAGLSEDGVIGPKTQAAFKGHYIKVGECQKMITAVEIICYCLGRDPHGVEYPGVFGEGLAAALNKRYLSGEDILALVE